jgi:transglutaminase-like putative cysteine protease
MNTPRLSGIAIIALSLLLSITAYAQDARLLARQAAGIETFKSAPAVTLWDSTAVQISDNGSGVFHLHRIVSVQNTEGAKQNRVIIYDYDPLTAEAVFTRVNIYRANGDTVQIDPATTCDYAMPMRMIYWGARQIMIEVGALHAGDIVDYEIDKRGFTYALLTTTQSTDDSRFIPPMKGEFYDIIPFWAETPTLRKVYRMSIPQQRNMHYEVFQGDVQVAITEEQDTKVYTFTADRTLPIQKEPGMVDVFDCAPKVLCSSTPTWQEKSRWFINQQEEYGSFSPTPEAEAKVQEILKGKKTEIERIAALSHWVADNIRYSGISMGEGEGYTLHNLQMNYTDRAGVCKDIASTLVSFLRIAGYEAYPAMTMAGSRIEKSIVADHFNHCVVVVKLTNGTLMPIDPTWIPFSRELWSSAEQQQNYLPGTPEGSDLLLTPVSAPENHYLKLTAKTKLSNNGTLQGTLTVEAEGYTDQRLRAMFTEGWESEWWNKLEQQFTALSPHARLLKADWGKAPRDYTAAPLRLVLQFELPNYAVIGEQEIIFKPLLMQSLFASFRHESRIDLTPDTRAFGFKIPCSQLLELDETLTLPGGWQVVSNDTPSAVSTQKGKLSFSATLSLDKRVYEADEWPAVRNAVQAFRNQNHSLILKKQ